MGLRKRKNKVKDTRKNQTQIPWKSQKAIIVETSKVSYLSTIPTHSITINQRVLVSKYLHICWIFISFIVKTWLHVNKFQNQETSITLKILNIIVCNWFNWAVDLFGKLLKSWSLTQGRLINQFCPFRRHFDIYVSPCPSWETTRWDLCSRNKDSTT